MIRRRTRTTVNLTAIAAQIAETRAAQAVIAAARRLRSPLTEARLLAAMICDPGVLKFAADVELEDFSDYRYQAAFTSLRSLEADGAPIGVLEIADDIAMADLVHEKRVSETVSVLFLGELICDQTPYHSNYGLLAHDKRWLRTLADRRAVA